MTQTANEARRSGLNDEAVIIQFLGRSGHIRRPTKVEDEQFDIDVFWNGESISIKSQPIAVSTGNLSFELDRIDRQQKYVPAWFRFGKAKFYLFHFGKRLALIDKAKLVTFLESRKDTFPYSRYEGFDTITLNRPTIVERETVSSNPFVNAKSGLIAYKTLESAGLIRYLANDLPAVID